MPATGGGTTTTPSGPPEGPGTTAGGWRGRLAPRYAAVPDSLRGLYERYCDLEAMGLLTLLSREGLRHFYRHAAAWAKDRPELADADPLAVVRRFARERLPLPEYDAWIPLYLANRRAFLEALEVPSAPRRDDPVAVAIRSFGDGWYAALCLTDAGTGWNGFLQFHRGEGVESYRTTDLFRREDAAGIRARFDAFDERTLVAFLRSVLP